jgi:flagellin
MTVINTNVSSLMAKNALQANSSKLSTAMERLSTGVRINSSKDDAAGLAITTRMESQIRGLNMAVRNANDGISLMQTTEGSLSEVTNMLQRMRELAVQAVNGANNDSDRNSLDAEVQQLKAEIDRIATTTQFNNQNVLDGSFKNKQFQIGDKNGSNIEVSINSVKTKDLGLGSGSGVSDTLVSSRLTIPATGGNPDIQKGDILINGQAVGAISDGDDMEDVLKAINDNVDNVKASAFNVVVAQQKGTGVTAADAFQITVKEMGQATATTFKISASNSIGELVSNINAETGGVVKAEINNDGKLQLSNSTGATITVDDNSATANAYDGGSGFENASISYSGFLKLESTDGSPVRIERGNLGLISPGNITDLESLGFRETAKASLGDAYTTTGIALTSTGVEAAWGRTDLTINGVQIYDENIATTSFQGKLDTINALSAETGVTASAYFEKVIDTSATFTGVPETGWKAADKVHLNGVGVALGANITALVTNINAETAQTGIFAKAEGANLILTGQNVQTMSLTTTNGSNAAQGGANNYLGLAAKTLGTVQTFYGSIKLNSTDDAPISIQLGDGSDVDEHGLLEMNVGAADFEVNTSTLGGVGGKAISGVNISSQASANDAILAIDKALDGVSQMRAKMGAIQNRLEYTISNLSNVSTNTSASRSRIMDTDYATETSNLAKAQIISQAATAMLAQANQSAQSVLALLK